MLFSKKIMLYCSRVKSCEKFMRSLGGLGPNPKAAAAAVAAAAAKSLQSCPTLCDPIEGSPSGSPVPGIL